MPLKAKTRPHGPDDGPFERSTSVADGGETAKPALALVAAIGSVSHGAVSASRLEAIIRGAEPAGAERAAIYQALSEAELHTLCSVAGELGMPFDELDARASSLFGRTLTEIHRWKDGSVC